jgi:hypothetical protein
MVAAAFAMFVLDLVVRRGLVLERLRRWLPATLRSTQNRRIA